MQIPWLCSSPLQLLTASAPPRVPREKPRQQPRAPPPSQRVRPPAQPALPSSPEQLGPMPPPLQPALQQRWGQTAQASTAAGCPVPFRQRCSSLLIPARAEEASPQRPVDQHSCADLRSAVLTGDDPGPMYRVVRV